MTDALVTKIDNLPQQYGGSRDVIYSIALRMKATFPVAKKPENELSLGDYMIGAQLALSRGLNPLTDIHLWKDRGVLQWTEHYTVYVRWAKRTEPYQEFVLPLDDLPQGDIGFRHYILRKSGEWMFSLLLKAALESGKSFEEAVRVTWEASGNYADGIVRRKEMFYQNGNPVDPPKGWSWEQVAKKRALRNAIREAYGTPGPDEIAQAGNWEIEGQPVLPEDLAQLEGIPENVRDEYLKQVAHTRELTAENRARIEASTPEEVTAHRVETSKVLRGDIAHNGPIGEDWQEGEFRAVDVTEDIPAPPEFDDYIPEPPEVIQAKSLKEAQDVLEQTQEWTVGDVRNVMLECGFSGSVKGKSIQDSIVEAVFGKPVTELNQDELHNLVQYTRRVAILVKAKDDQGVEIPIPTRLGKIPELPEDVTTITAAKEFLKELARSSERIKVL